MWYEVARGFQVQSWSNRRWRQDIATRCTSQAKTLGNKQSAWRCGQQMSKCVKSPRCIKNWTRCVATMFRNSLNSEGFEKHKRWITIMMLLTLLYFQQHHMNFWKTTSIEVFPSIAELSNYPLEGWPFGLSHLTMDEWSQLCCATVRNQSFWKRRKPETRSGHLKKWDGSVRK